MMISLAYGVYYIYSTHVKYGRLSWIAFFCAATASTVVVYRLVDVYECEGSTKWILFVRCYFVTCALQLSMESKLANQIESAKCCKIIYPFFSISSTHTNDMVVKNCVHALICRWELCQNI